MPSSNISLDSLSSPSPSPSPRPTIRQGPEPSNAGLDSGSELSELTDEEQEAERNNVKNNNKQTDRKQVRQFSRRGMPRKRGGIVPAPMWGWAKPKKDDKNSTVVEEEEEEEMAEPLKAMEEEEDEEDEDDSVPPASRPRLSPSAIEDEDEDDVDEGHAAAVDDNGEDDTASDEDDAPTMARSVRRPVPAVPPQDEDEVSFTSEDEEYRVDEKAHRSREEDDENDEELSDVSPAQAEPQIDSDNDIESMSDDQDFKERDIPETEPSSLPTTNSTMEPSKLSASATLMDIDDDLPTPVPPAAAPSAAVVAASSIMAGSQVIEDPPSPSSSDSLPSRSPSPILPQTTSGGANRVASPRLKRAGKQKPAVPLKETNASVKKANGEVDAIIVPFHDESVEQVGSPEDIDADEPSPDQDLVLELEMDLQPQHRAEALDVLATIELKFALLRERVYVEKMEGLAWEESLVGEGTHPELIHLQAELSKRRDKRIELATRKRAYEVANVTKRRRLDEDATWSWWKVARDELQTEMIAETNRKRRKLERERRAAERSQPVRRIPNRPHDIPAPPSIRKIVKSYPFQDKPAKREAHLAASAASYVYPELTTLPPADIAKDLEYLFQNRRPVFEPHRMPSIMNMNMNAQMPPLHAYDAYAGVSVDGMPVTQNYGAAAGNRMHPPPQPPPFQIPNQQLHHILPSTQQPLPALSSYGASGPVRTQQQQLPPPSVSVHNNSMSQFTMEHEPAPAHHRYFGSAQVAGAGSNGYPSQAQSQLGGVRRSPSPGHVGANGPGGPVKPNGKAGWLGGLAHAPKHGHAANEWTGDPRRADMILEEEERERERTREARRERERDKGKDRSEREREREREREMQEAENERERERNFHLQQIMQQARHAPPPPQAPPSSHVHTSTGVPHHHSGHHHHHHHHHVLHHHHPHPAPNSSSATSSITGPAVSPHIQPSREFDPLPRSSNHASHGHTPDTVSLIPSKSSHWKGDEPHIPPTEYRDVRAKHGVRTPSGPSAHDERERPLAMPFVMSSTHPISPPNHSRPISSGSAPINNASSSSTTYPGHSRQGSWGNSNNVEDGPYRISSSSSAPTGYLGAASVEPHSHSHGHTHSRTHSNSHSAHSNSNNSSVPHGQHRYAHPSSSNHLGRGPPPPALRQNSLGLSPPRSRPFAPSSPSSSALGPVRSLARPPPLLQTPGSSGSIGPPPPQPLPRHSSPTLKPTHRPNSPASSSSKMSGGLPPSTVYSPRLMGPGRTLTPGADSNSKGLGGAVAGGPAANGVAAPPPPALRTSSPLVPFPSPSVHPSLPPPGPRPLMSATTNGVGAGIAGLNDKTSPRLPPMLPPPPTKMNVAQMIDGR